MEGTIVNFRSGRHTQTNNQMIISVEGMDKEKAKALVGKEVVWKSPANKELKGKVTSVHGTKGALRVLFEKGMPGQSLGKKIEIKN